MSDDRMRTWDGQPHGPPAVAVPEPLTGEPDAEEWGEAMRSAKEKCPGASRISVEWMARDFFVAVWGVGSGLDPLTFRLSRRRPRHPRG